MLDQCLSLKGYAAREFAKQGLKPGELAVISKEAKTWLGFFFFIIGSFKWKKICSKSRGTLEKICPGP
ncbi:hypothetical protein L3X38_016074 [Prunus dulcis]|uniref:Uncharacterized protein n=1 Tax=Prunus dulcis TaxID=3755 RepID=A0AAD4Z8G3_PRUDU|nr:hypothetical protein L3X38_016074 [Prunus dulcis]